MSSIPWWPLAPDDDPTVPLPPIPADTTGAEAPGARGGAPGPEPVIELTGVSRVFPAQPPVHALTEVSISIADGDYVAVMGTSGSGKSTLLNILGLLDRPTAGTYRLCGLDVGELNEGERAGARGAWLGFVFQSFHLLAGRSATENVMLAGLYAGRGTAERRHRALEVLDQVHLGHRRDALPATMSGGECQRVAIARALAHRPRVLLCDEPTGALDSHTTAAILALLDELNAHGLTIVLITHDAAVAAHAPRQISIEDGQLTEIAAVGSRP